MADDNLDPEQGSEDHHVPADLLELYEVLEWEGKAVLQPRAKATTGKFIEREAWGARPARGFTRLDNPQGVTWHYEGPRMGNFPHSSCATKVRGIQNFHMNSRGWTDGAYNAIVCPHGYIYELRGRDVRSAANGTNAGNSASHAICALIGDGDTVTDDLLHGLLDARLWLIAGGTGHKTWGHRDWKATACPGNPLYSWFKGGMRRPGGAVTPPAPPVVTPPVGGPKCGESHPQIRRGATGSRVNHLQYLLQRTGAQIAGDGDFGPATENALRNAQSFMQIPADGICGVQTWATLHRHVDGLGI